MKYLFHLIIKSHVILFSLGFLLYILERLTGYVHFFEIFLRERRSEEELLGSTLFYTLCYFMFMLMILLIDLFLTEKIPEDFPFSIWFYIIFVLSMMFAKIYYDYNRQKLSK